MMQRFTISSSCTQTHTLTLLLSSFVKLDCFWHYAIVSCMPETTTTTFLNAHHALGWVTSTVSLKNFRKLT